MLDLHSAAVEAKAGWHATNAFTSKTDQNLAYTGYQSRGWQLGRRCYFDVFRVAFIWFWWLRRSRKKVEKIDADIKKTIVDVQKEANYVGCVLSKPEGDIHEVAT